MIEELGRGWVEPQLLIFLCCFAFGTRSFRVPARRAAPFSKPSRCCLAPVLLLRLTT